MCLPTLLDLPATKTHDTRRAVWSPLTGELHDGTLTVCQGRRELSSYLVQLNRDERGDLVALLRKDDGDVYECRRVERGWACSCPGHRRHGHCKHADGLSAAEGDGLLGG